MENQHREIKGYRELSREEIDLMNEVKEEGLRLEALVAKVEAHVQTNQTKGAGVSDNPSRWLALGRTDLQVGLMKLTRAIARPTFF